MSAGVGSTSEANSLAHMETMAEEPWAELPAGWAGGRGGGGGHSWLWGRMRRPEVGAEPPQVLGVGGELML